MHVHGLSGDATLRERQQKLRDDFLQRRGNHHVLSNLCIDLLRERLSTSESELDRLVQQLFNSRGIRHLLESFFASDDIWRGLQGHLIQERAADKLRAYSQEQQSDFLRIAVRYKTDHRWRYMRHPPSDVHLFQVIKTLCILIAKSAERTHDDIESVDAIGKAADAKDQTAIADWASRHRDWETAFDAGAWLSIYKSLLAHTAQYFQHRS